MFVIFMPNSCISLFYLVIKTKLVFPSGIIYDKNLDDYRTDEENEEFKVFRRFTTIYIADKEKATTELLRLSPCVGMRRLERPTPTSRT